MGLRGFRECGFECCGWALNVEGIEIGRMDDRKAEGFETSREPLGMLMDTESDLVKAFGAVMDCVHRGESGKEGLGCADVAGGTVPADMLLASLEGQAIGGTTCRILRDTDQAARKKALVGDAGGKVGGVGSPKTDGDAESLGAANGDIGAQFARGSE